MHNCVVSEQDSVQYIITLLSTTCIQLYAITQTFSSSFKHYQPVKKSWCSIKRDKRTNLLFGAKASFDQCRLCDFRKFGYLQKYGYIELGKFCHGILIIKRAINLAGERWMLVWTAVCQLNWQYLRLRRSTAIVYRTGHQALSTIARFCQLATDDTCT